MKKRSITPKGSPKARRSAKRTPQQHKESREQRKQRVLARTKVLVEIARHGESAEEIMDKGEALAEIKRLRPWNAEGHKGGFRKWVKRNLPYEVARANHYIFISANVNRALVKGKLVCFEALLVISRAAADKHQMLIEEAHGGATAQKLRLLALGDKVPDPLSLEEVARRVVELQNRQATELRLLTQMMNEGKELPEDLRAEILKGGAVQQGLIAAFPGPKGGDPGGGEGPKVDPIGSTCAASPSPASAAEPPEPGPAPASTPATARPATVEQPGQAHPPSVSSASIPPALQLPAEVLPFRSLFRFFHRELTPGRQIWVQNTLAGIVRGSDPAHRLADLNRELRPFLPKGHPMKKEMSQLAVLLRGEKMARRRFALDCLIAARLPECEVILRELAQADLPAGLLELVRTYCDLLLPPSLS